MEPKMGGMTDDKWEALWSKDGDPNHHRKEVHKLLHNHFEKVTKQVKNLRVFVPLCGKSLDMKWFSDLGHTIVGVELVESPIKTFFEGHNIEYSTSSTTDGMTLYKSSDGKIRIFVGDLFRLSREVLGVFDVIWDRAALVALGLQDMKKYITQMKTLLAPGGWYLLATMDYDTNKHSGPPAAIGEEKIKELFGSDYQVKYLESWDSLVFANPAWGLDWFLEKLFVIVKEQKQD